MPLLHAYLNNDPPCLEYPYVEGGTLARLLDERRQSPAGSFTPAQVERIVLQVAQIVGPAHRAVPKLVHRDLKPSNVLVERLADGTVKLRVTDFGIGGLAAQPILERSRSSSSLEGDLSAVLTGAYSPLYASPQQMNGEKPDTRDDVYALGVIWHQLLTGDLTSPAPTGRRWVDELRDRGTSDEALDLLSSCFESKPAHRPDDAVVLADGLEAISSSRAIKGDATRVTASAVETIKPPSVEPPPAPTPKVPLVPSPSPIEPLIAPEAPPRCESKRGGRVRGRLAAGALGLCAVFGIIIYVATDNGWVMITGTDDRMKVMVDEQVIGIENLGKPISVRAGTHHLLVTRDGLTVKSEAFEINRFGEKLLEVPLTRPKPDELPKAEAPKATGSDPHPSAGAKSSAPVASANPSPRSEPKDITTVAGRIKLKLIPAGEFTMGSDESDLAAERDESVVNDGKKQKHRVRITRPFYLGVTEVTRGQFRTFVDETGYKTDAEKDGRGSYGWDEESDALQLDAKFTCATPASSKPTNIRWST